MTVTQIGTVTPLETWLRMAQKADKEQRCSAEIVHATNENEEVKERLDSGEAMIAAGTSWLWAREDMERRRDEVLGLIRA